MGIQTALANELERLIAYRPVTGYNEQMGLLFDYLEAELSELDLKIKRGEHKGYPYILAGTKSTAKSKVLLQAHVDVVPAEPSQFRLVNRDGKLYGRGSYDMLFATASYLILLRELHAKNNLQKLDLGIMLTSDEEIGGFEGVGELIKTYDCQVCFLPDAGSFTAACIKSKGVLQIEVTSIGVAGHSSRPDIYKSPILPLTEFISAFNREFPNDDTGAVTYAVTRISSGSASNQVPHAAKATLDIRYPVGEDATEIQEKVVKLAKRYNLSTEQIELAMPYEANADDPGFRAFADIYTEVTGAALKTQHNLGSSDARFFTEKSIPVIMIRPDGGDIHGEQEWVGAESLRKFYTVLKAYITKEAQ